MSQITELEKPETAQERDLAVNLKPGWASCSGLNSSQGESMAMMEIPTIATTAPGTGSRISPTITPVKTAK